MPEVSQSEAGIIYSGGRVMVVVKIGVIPRNAPLMKKCTRVNSVIDLLDLGRLQRPNRNSFFSNLPIQHEFVYLLAVVKPRVPPKDVYICEVRSSSSLMSLKGFPEDKLMTQKFFMSG